MYKHTHIDTTKISLSPVIHHHQCTTRLLIVPTHLSSTTTPLPSASGSRVRRPQHLPLIQVPAAHVSSESHGHDSWAHHPSVTPTCCRFSAGVMPSACCPSTPLSHPVGTMPSVHLEQAKHPWTTTMIPSHPMGATLHDPGPSHPKGAMPWTTTPTGYPSVVPFHSMGVTPDAHRSSPAPTVLCRVKPL